MGDINCDLNTPMDTKHLNNTLNSFGYSQLIKDATKTTKTPSTIIYHIITDRPDIISSGGVRPCGISDHDALFLIRNTRAPKLKAPPKVITVRKYKRFNMVDFQSNLKEIPMEYIKLVAKDVNEVRLRWKAFFLDILHKHALVTKITVKGSSLPLWHLSWGPWLKLGTTLQPKQIRQDLNVYGRPLTIPETKWTNFFQTYKKLLLKKIEENKDNLKGTWKILKQESKSGTTEERSCNYLQWALCFCWKKGLQWLSQIHMSLQLPI